jgi:hypothetical protein
MTPSRTSSSPIGQFTGQRLGPHPHSGPMRIQNVAWLLTSTSFVCTNSRVPSLPIRTTDRHAGTWCTSTPSLDRQERFDPVRRQVSIKGVDEQR